MIKTASHFNLAIRQSLQDMAHLSAFQMVTRTRACHVLLNLGFFLKSMGAPRVSVLTAVTSPASGCAEGTLLRAESLRFPNVLWLRRQMGAAAAENMQGWEFLCGSGGINTVQGNIIFNKGLFCILHEGDRVTLGGMELQIKFYLTDTVTEAHPSALVWKQSCYLAMLLSKTMLIWYNYCDFKNY